MTRIQNSPAAYGWLAGLLVFLLGLVANSSCAHYPTPHDVLEPSRTGAQRDEAAVAIFTQCGIGSGVLLNGREVFTAFHVINCADFPEVQLASAIVVRTRSGTTHLVANVAAQPGFDLARLTLDSEAPNVTPVRVRAPKMNETLCAYTVIPERGVRCGFIEKLGGDREYGDVFVRAADYWFGNSGSGVYGEDGALVAITTRLNWCSQADALLWLMADERPARTCGGYVASLAGTKVLP